VALFFAVITFWLGYQYHWASYGFLALACVVLDWQLWRAERFKTPARVTSSIITLAAVVWIGFNALGYVTIPASPDELLVLLAEFDNQSQDKNYNATGRIRTRLEEELKKSNITNARFVVAPTVNSHNEARALGRRHNAVFVIWGYYDDAGFNPYFTIIRESPKPLVKTELKEIPAELREFNLYIRESLPAHMAYFATFTLGQLYYGDKKYDEALRSFDVALANLEQARRVAQVPQPEGSESLYFYRGYIHGAIKRDFDQALSDYTKVIELDPKLAQAYNNRGLTYVNKGNLDQALSDYAQAIELDPKNATTYNNRGIAYYTKGNLDQAIADFNKAIDLDSKGAQAYYNRGIAYYTKGNLDQALRDYNKAIDLDPKLAQAYYNRGLAYADQGYLDQALRDYNKAIDLDPKLAQAYNNRGLTYVAKGNLDQALSNFTKALELDPKYAIAYYNRGTAHYTKGNLEQALRDYTTAIDLDPNYSAAYNNRGIAYRQKGNLDQALSDYTKALELDPKHATTYNNRGVAYVAKGNLEQALSDFTKAIELDPKYAAAYNNRGTAYRQQGLKPQAIADLKPICALCPMPLIAHRLNNGFVN
jgi:tetratricopeptide (TPR) repeat protein